MNYYNPYATMQGQAQPLTNKIYVTSAEDALSRFANFNSVTVYFLQDESTVFEVFTDMQGKKSIKARKLTDIEPSKPQIFDGSNYVTKEEFETFKAQFKEKDNEVK